MKSFHLSPQHFSSFRKITLPFLYFFSSICSSLFVHHTYEIISFNLMLIFPNILHRFTKLSSSFSMLFSLSFTREFFSFSTPLSFSFPYCFLSNSFSMQFSVILFTLFSFLSLPPYDHFSVLFSAPLSKLLSLSLFICEYLLLCTCYFLYLFSMLFSSPFPDNYLLFSLHYSLFYLYLPMIPFSYYFLLLFLSLYTSTFFSLHVTFFTFSFICCFLCFFLFFLFSCVDEVMIHELTVLTLREISANFCHNVVLSAF